MIGSAARTAGAILTAALVTGTLLTDWFDRIGIGDVDRVREARWVLVTSCQADTTAEAMDGATAVLEHYFRRAPDQPVPLSGGGGVWSMRFVVTEAQRFLARPVVAAHRLGGDAPAADAPCRRFGPPLAARLSALLDASPTGH